MIKLNVVTKNSTVALQFFDYFFAYQQNKNKVDYQNLSVKIVFNQALHQTQTIDILLLDHNDIVHYPEIEKFDLVLFDNRGEPLIVANEQWPCLLDRYPNVYFLTGSHVNENHALSDRIITFNHNLTLFTDCVSRPFYPQHYTLKQTRSCVKDHDMIFINGQNRAWRNYFLQSLREEIPDMVVKNSISSTTTKLLDCQFESLDDREFRIWINENTINQDLEHFESMKYYEKSFQIGIDNKFGKIPPGYFLIDEYLTYKCIIYPETSWINDELFLTEKTWKCLVGGVIPWPIAGSNFHSMMTKFGFFTAVDLLPDHLKQFDSLTNHRERYHAQIQSIKFAVEHPEIWDTPRAHEIRQENLRRFWHNDLNLIGLEKFEKILQQF